MMSRSLLAPRPLSPEDFSDVICQEGERSVVEAYLSQGPQSWAIQPGGERPALIVVDVQLNVVGRDVPLLDAMAESRMTIGERAHRALPHLGRVLGSARSAGIPVIFTALVPEGRSIDDDGFSIHPMLVPLPHESTLRKRQASAFFGTSLDDFLRDLGVDTLVVAGCSTSGCVRATAVDAQQRGLSVIVPAEAVFDRFHVSHRAALFDLWLKYAVVADVDEVVRFMASIGERQPR